LIDDGRRDNDYTKLSLAEVVVGLENVRRQVQATFGALNGEQLNWRPDATRWSVAQGVEHLLTSGNQIRQAADDALTGSRPQTIWQRLPLLPRIAGRLMIRSLSPQATRKLAAPSAAQPASNISADVIRRFVEQHGQLVGWMNRLDETNAACVIMTSPYVDVVTYSVLDACRILIAHDRRHFEQARRVMALPGFPV
jgi:hypothetical protein